MARPSKLTDAQRVEIREHLLNGTKAADLAEKYKVHPSQITRCGTKPLAREREVATQLVNAEIALRQLPQISQLNVLALADELRQTVLSIASAGRLGAATANRLAGLAHGIVTRVQLSEDGTALAAGAVDKLREAKGLIGVANEAGAIAMQTMGVLKVQATRALENPVSKDMGKAVEISEQDAAQAYQDLMRGT